MIGTFAMVILAPFAAALVQMAISRTREYAADRMGEIVGEPRYLASALARLENAAHQIPNEAAERDPATAHLFIINPLSGQRMNSLFSTHPATENRIAALEQLAAQMGRSRQPEPRQGGAGANCGTRCHAVLGAAVRAAVPGAEALEIDHQASRRCFVTMPKLIRRPFGAVGASRWTEA